MLWFEPPNELLSWEYIAPKVLDDANIEFLEGFVADNPSHLVKAEVRTGNDNPVDADYRRSDIMFLQDIAYFQSIYDQVLKAALTINSTYFKYSLNYSELFQYSVYKEDDQGYYDIHCDSHLRNTSGSTRKLSFSILLTDPSEFEGGDLLLHTNRDPFKVELDKGDIVLFPSFIPHSVTPVTKGVRRTLVGWICGPNFV